MKAWLGVASASVIAGLGAACSSEQNVAMSDVPAAVRATLERETAGGKITEVEKEKKNGHVVYSADATINGQGYDITVAEDGRLISKEREQDEHGEKSEKK